MIFADMNVPDRYQAPVISNENSLWLVRLRNAATPEHKFHPAKWLTFIAFLLWLAQLAAEFFLSAPA